MAMDGPGGAWSIQRGKFRGLNRQGSAGRAAI